MGVAVGDGGATATESQQFAVLAFLETLVFAVGVHLVACKNFIHRLVGRPDITLETAACHQSAFGRDSEMAVATVATVVDGILVQSFGDMP